MRSREPWGWARAVLLVAAVLPATACRSNGAQRSSQDGSARDVVAGGDAGRDTATEAPADAIASERRDAPAEIAEAVDAALPDAVDAPAPDAVDAGAPDVTTPPPCEAGGCPAVRSVVAGGGATCAVFAGGRIKCWGSNTYGALGIGDETNRGDRPGQMGQNLPFVDLGAGRTVVALTMGVGHSCAVLDSGALKCWGANVFGQLGLGHTQARGTSASHMGDNLPAIDLGQGLVIAAVAAGYYHTCAVLGTGQVKCWGDNLDSKLGTVGPYRLGGAPGEMGDNLPFVNLGAGRTALAVAPGVGHTCALLDTHQIKCWGSNLWGGLGRGDEPAGAGLVNLGTGRSALAVSAGHGHTCALLDTHEIKCWGRNELGELGLGDRVDRGARTADMGDNLPAIDLGSGRTARSVAALDGYTCAVLDDGALKCWGANNHGQLGQGDTAQRGYAPGQMGDALTALDLAAGGPLRVFAARGVHNCALFEGGRLACWGQNNAGQLGQGDTASRGDQLNELAALPSIDVGGE